MNKQLSVNNFIETNAVCNLTATEFIERAQRGDLSAEEYALSCIQRIEQLEPDLHAWTSYDPERFLTLAREADAKRQTPKWTGAPMLGVPVGVKDIYNTWDLPTGHGSPILEGYTPGNDARVISDIRLAGGLIAGKTDTAEFAVHQLGTAKYPFDPHRTPGTSSGGSAVAVASQMVPVALGSQTGGSIIRPASYCGIVGLKPSFGLLPRTGVLKTTDTLDTLGCLARSVDDVRLLFDVMRVRGHNYPTSEAGLADPERSQRHGEHWRIGLLEQSELDEESGAINSALRGLASNLPAEDFDLVEVQLPPELEQAHSVHDAIYCRSLSYYFKSEWQSAPEKFSEVLAEMIRNGLETPVEEYHRALEMQRTLSKSLDRLMSDFDAILCASTASEAPLLDQFLSPPDYCLLWTMCGVPTISLPLLSGMSGLPVGAQLVGQRFSDYRLLDCADALMRVPHG